MSSFIIPLSDPDANLEMVGGKGMSLAKLARAGFPVPDGFHVTTSAYRQFVTANGLQEQILTALGTVDTTIPATLEAASRTIGQAFAGATIPLEIARSIREGYDNLSDRQAKRDKQPIAVAVRSSATAEDLPGASFAGQQETYLNIHGAESVLAAVQKCWASLWTGRAIAYRLHQGIPPDSVALAVVVQILVPAEAAGILFTANPLSSRRSETVINAAWGLGEAIVGGLVTPDTITVNKDTGGVARRETTEKLLMTVRTESGTEQRPVPDSLKNKAVLNDKQSVELMRYGSQIEELYGTPMDIEWAWTSSRGFSILQARPITTLGEAPLEWKPPRPKAVYMRASVVDLMPDPISPLFATLGISSLTANMDPLSRYLIHAKAFMPQDYYTTINGYAYMCASFSFRGWLWVLFSLLPAFPRILRMAVRFWREEARPRYQTTVAQALEKDPAGMTSTELWQAIQKVMDSAGYYTCTLMFATMGASSGSEGLLTKVYQKMVQRAGDPSATALLMGWNNIAIRAEKSLYDLSGFCREDETLKAHVLNTPSDRLVEQLTGEEIPAGVERAGWQEFHRRFDRHLEEFGHMIFEMDFAKPLPRDHPGPMLEAVKMYLRGEGANPHERQRASEAKRLQTAASALARLKGIRRWAFVKSLNWAQSLAEVREDALADIGLGYPVMRGMLHMLGERLVKAGALQNAGDIFWLEKDEVDKAMAALERCEAPESMLERVDQRKAFWQKAKAATPPPILPPRKKYMGINTNVWLAESEDSQSGNTLKGAATSPGQVTAPARVLHGPEDFTRMQPGEVLVAGTTTPAWTPLFAMASAVVTDIGGPLSHGSIVAREYGIPAVMGTGVATRRIRDGQMITVDGSAGTVTILAADN